MIVCIFTDFHSAFIHNTYSAHVDVWLTGFKGHEFVHIKKDMQNTCTCLDYVAKLYMAVHGLHSLSAKYKIYLCEDRDRKSVV